MTTEAKKFRMPEKGGEIPFKEPLKESELHDTLEKLASLPNKVIRNKALERFFGSRFHGSDKQLYFEGIEDPREALNVARELFDKLESEYSIKIPPTEMIIGKNKWKEDSVYVITEKVEGDNLIDMDTGVDREAKIEQVKNVLESVIRYFEDAYKSNELFLFDIGRKDQYVYGKIKDDLENSIYLVDTDMHRVTNDKKVLFKHVHQLSHFILDMEELFNTKFTGVRDKFQSFINSINEENPDLDEVREMVSSYASSAQEK